MNTEEDEFKRIEAEAKRRAAHELADTQVYTSDVALAEAYRCGFEAGAVAEREACAKLVEPITALRTALEQQAEPEQMPTMAQQIEDARHLERFKPRLKK